MQRNKPVKVAGSPAVRGATVHSPELAGVSSPVADSGSGDTSVDGPVQISPAGISSYDETGQETLNLPAVLWDKPPGSKTRVPPPVPPRSPKRPLDPTGAFANAAALQDANNVRGWAA